MRLALLLPVLAAGCASLDPALHRPADGPYRIPGRAPDPLPFSAEPDARAYALEPAAGVGYDLDAALDGGEARVIVVLQNRGRAPLRYDLGRLALTGRGERRLERVTVQDDPSRRPTPAERAGEPYRQGLREVLRGERLVVTRRFRVADADVDDTARILSALELDDEVLAGDQAAPVKLRLERVR